MPDIRKAVPVDGFTLDLVGQLRHQDAEIRLILAELIQHEPGTSEASLLSALLHLGSQCVRQRAAEHGYAALAAEQAADPQHQAERAARRQRRAERDATAVA